MRSSFRRNWTRALLHDTHYGDRHKKLNALYRISDPWGLDCSKERFRFAATNMIIKREFGVVGTILEIGCGEGLQSLYFSEICERLYGIDVSPMAVARAQERYPSGDFKVGDIMRPLDWSEEVDLVVACEVLYYVKDTRKFLHRMSELGRACLISYHAPHRVHLEPEIAVRRNAKSEVLKYDTTEWIASWWKNTETERN